MDALLAIPEEVSRQIISLWITLAELSKLDIAYCNRDGRRLLHGLTRKLCPFFNTLSGHSRNLRSKEQLEWLSSRGVLVENITVPVGKNGIEEAVKSYVTHCGSALQSIVLIQRQDYTNASLVNMAKILTRYCPYLKSIRLSYLINVSREVLLQFADGCPAVESLHLDYCGFTSEGESDYDYNVCCWANAIAPFWSSSLVHLNISHTSCEDSDVTIIVRSCVNLQTLDISKCDVTDASVFEIATHCPHLTLISLNDTDVGDESISVLAQRCTKLSEVVLGLNNRISDASLHALAVHCPSLHSLDISECEFITDAGMEILAQYCPQLTLLDISESLGVTDTGALSVAYSCPQMHTFRVHETMVSATLLELMGERVDVTKSFTQNDWLIEQGGRYWKNDVHEIDLDGEGHGVNWERRRVNSDY